MMLYKLLAGMQGARFKGQVASLTDIGPVGERIQALGVPVVELGARGARDAARSLVQLSRLIRQSRPAVVQTWLYHADMLGGLAARLSSVPVVWNVRQASLSGDLLKKGTLATARVCARLSSWVPRQIVCCSSVARDEHIRFGYSAEKMRVIPNGFDLDAFRPDPQARMQLRQELRLPDDALAIGLVARFDPFKDHETFIRATAELLQRPAPPNVYFVMCGDGVTWENRKLGEWIARAGGVERFRLLGRRTDLPRINAALDLAVLSSRSEGFPNVLGEAMACGVPCVATAVGETPYLIGDTGRVAPPADPVALADAIADVLLRSSESRRALGLRARARIRDLFSLDAVVRQYEQLYWDVLSRN